MSMSSVSIPNTRGYVQVDTAQYASYLGTWANPKVDWNRETGWLPPSRRLLRSDPGFNAELRLSSTSGTPRCFASRFHCSPVSSPSFKCKRAAVVEDVCLGFTALHKSGTRRPAALKARRWTR